MAYTDMKAPPTDASINDGMSDVPIHGSLNRGGAVENDEERKSSRKLAGAFALQNNGA
jgi:hypothetical protein